MSMRNLRAVVRSTVLSTWVVVATFACLPAAADESPALQLPDGSRTSTELDEASGQEYEFITDGANLEAEKLVSEIVTERFPSGAVKLHRYVALDADGNYVNHGNFVQYDERGKIVAQGMYDLGKQTGRWVRTLSPTEAISLAEQLGNAASNESLSEATFAGGQLHGVWIVKTRDDRKLMELHFKHGVLHGTSTWWHANGQKRKEAGYARGKLHGHYQEWGPDAKLVSDRTYSDGRVLVKQDQSYSQGHPSCEGTMLAGADVFDTRFDWWRSVAQVKVVGKSAPDQRHGKWTFWHPNGQKKSEGAYREDQPVGRFTWWYDNGQKQAEGEYLDGLLSGVWVSWHPNGMKASQGEYIASVPSSLWRSWNPDGKLAESRDYDGAVGSRPSVAKPTEDDADQPAKDEQVEIGSKLPMRVGRLPPVQALR